MFEITQLTSLNIPILIILIGAFFLYFGRIIGETKVEKYDKLGYYREGLFFFAVYIYVPSLFAYYIYQKNLFMAIAAPSFLLIFIQIVILTCLSWNLYAHGYVRKYELLDELKKKAEEKVNEIKEQDSFIGKLTKYGENRFDSLFRFGYIDYIKNLAELTYYKIPIKIIGNKYILGIFSFLTIISIVKLYIYGDLLSFGISSLLAFFILTMIALAYGFGDAYYPPGKIHIIDGEIIEGKILKFDEYVYVLKDDKKIFVNKDKINYVEENKFKEDEK